MAQFADVAISVVSDDEDSSSENDRTEPETESRPMIGRLSRSRDRADGQSDESDGLLGIVKNGVGKQNGGVSGSPVPNTGSSGCFGTSLSPTTLLILCLLVAAFPVHFPAILLPDIRSPTDVALRLTVCLAIVGSIVASMTSQLTFKMADGGNFRSLLLGGSAGVTVFVVVRCFRSVPVAVLGGGAFVAGYLLTAVRVAAAGEYCRPLPSPPVGGGGGGLRPRRNGVDAATYLASGLLVMVCSGLAPFVSSLLNLVLLATDPVAELSMTSLLTSSVTSLPVGNATLDVVTAANLSFWSDDINTSSAATPFSTSLSTRSTSGSFVSRSAALSVCYVVCSLGALLLALQRFDDSRHRKDKSVSGSGFYRLVLGPLCAFRRQDVALLTLMALYVGAQQLFAYFTFIQVRA